MSKIEAPPRMVTTSLIEPGLLRIKEFAQVKQVNASNNRYHFMGKSGKKYHLLVLSSQMYIVPD